MKKLTLLCASVIASVQFVLAQTDSVAAEALELVEEQKGIDWSNVGSTVLGILVLIGSLAIIAHMIYDNYFKKPHAALDLDQCRASRKNQGLKPMTDAEAQGLLQKIEDVYTQWTQFKDEEGTDKLIMTKYSQTKKTLAVLDEVAAACPDREDVVNAYNELNQFYNEAMERHYNGSTKYIILCVVVAALLAWMSGGSNWWGVLIFFALQIAIYWLASKTPAYLLYKKELKGSNRPGCMSGTIAGILGMAATAEAVTTVTKWSDGTTTKETDSSNVWISWIITIILLIVLAYLMFVVALVNYLRNYVLHI